MTTVEVFTVEMVLVLFVEIVLITKLVCTCAPTIVGMLMIVVDVRASGMVDQVTGRSVVSINVTSVVRVVTTTGLVVVVILTIAAVGSRFVAVTVATVVDTVLRLAVHIKVEVSIVHADMVCVATIVAS